MIRKRDFIKQFVIFLLSVLISVVLLLIITIFFSMSYSIFSVKDITLNDIFPHKKITLMDINPTVATHKNLKESAIQGTTLIDSSKTDSDKRVQVKYYIIIGSLRNLLQAQQKAKKLLNDFKTDIVILPPTPEGYYRISYGKYSTLEEAKFNLISIRKNINPDAWIFSVKE